MKESKERLKDVPLSAGFIEVLERFPHPVLIHYGGIVRYVNRACSKLLGGTKAMITGRKVLDLLHPDFHEVSVKRINDIVTKGRSTPPLEVRLIDLRGNEKVAEIMGIPVNYEGNRAVLVTSNDVSREKLALEELAVSEKKFKMLAEESPNMIFINYRGRIVYANRACVHVMGYKRSELYAPDFDFLTLVVPRYREDMRKYFQLHAKGIELDAYEYAVVTRKGKELNVLQNTKLIDYEGGKAILGIITDITARRMAENKVQESEGRFRDLFENAHDLIQSVAEDGSLVYVNKAWLDTLGYRLSEIRRLNMRDFIHPDSMAHCQKLFEEVLAGKSSCEVNAAFVKKNGEKVEVRGSITLHKSVSGRLMTQGIFMDVTQSRRAQAELQESEERYRTLNEAAFDAIVVSDQEGKIISWNKGAKAMFGYSRQEAQGKPLRLIIPERLEKKHSEAFRRFLIDKKPNVLGKVMELEGIRKNGEAFPLEINLSSWSTSKGRYFSGIIRDITDRKRLDNEIKAINEKLEERVFERTEQLEKANSEIRALLREMHHRVKNNLQIVSSLLNMQASNIENDLVSNAFRESQDRIQTMAFIHESLYLSESMSEISVKKYLEPLVRERIRANADINNHIELKSKFPDVVFKIDTMLPVGLLLNELVTNSLKHAFPNKANGRIAVTMDKKSGGWFELSYSDNGIGFPVRSPGDSEETLGLILIDSFVKQLNGKVTRLSGRGTRYKITFRSV